MLTVDYGGLAVDYVINILIFTLIPIWNFLFNSIPQWVFRTSFLIIQINGFNKHALNSNKAKLYNIYTISIQYLYKIIQYLYNIYMFLNV